MSDYELLRENCKYCDNCWSCNNLEAHHKIFRSEKHKLQKIISSRKDTFRESYRVELDDYWIDDIQNLVLLCFYCHKERIHNWDIKLRNYYRDRITINYIQIPYDKNIWKRET